jgi:succinyl-CoA:(S)-malate CoA-transferase subunit A/succinyl-CoA:(S)-malate CoA-transferase subunit B
MSETPARNDAATDGATPLPLAGVRVLDVATFIAAPFCATILGEFGAEVIKVEQPGAGDPFRRFGTPTDRGDTLAWQSEARNKRSITLDLRQPAGAALFKRLVAESQVVCESFRPGTLERWGLGWEALAAVNPRLVLLRVSGYGQTGPYRDRPGFARIAHAFGGLTHLAGMPGGPPVTPGSTSLADYITGLYGAIGTLLALRHAEATGQGQAIDIALYESIFRVLDEIAPAYARTGKVRAPEGTGTLTACPHGQFRCGDGQWVAIACTSDKMFARFAGVIGRPDLAADDRYGRIDKRLAGRDEVDRVVNEWTGSLPRDAVIAACAEGEVPCGSVNTIADIFADPQFQARGNLLALDDGNGGEIVVPNVLPKLAQTPGRVAAAGPRLGADNAAIYGDLLGLSPAEQAALARDKVI